MNHLPRQSILPLTISTTISPVASHCHWRTIASSSKLPSPPSPQPRSTTASPSIPSTVTTPPSSQQSSLTWDEYLQLRKSRRWAGLATSIPSTLLAAASSGSYFLNQEIDPSQAIAGIDPIYIYGALTLASTGLGYLIGPTVGSSLWSLLHRTKLTEMESKDADFYSHIKAHRVDPSRANMQNPIPDFYGEKISSRNEYRRWLRDCSLYRTKAAHGLREQASSQDAATRVEDGGGSL